MNYKNLQILTIVSIIVGVVIFFSLQFVLGTLGYMEVWVQEDPYIYRADRNYQYEAVISIWYSIVLTIIVFIVYPILYLRKVKQKSK